MHPHAHAPHAPMQGQEGCAQGGLPHHFPARAKCGAGSQPDGWGAAEARQGANYGGARGDPVVSVFNLKSLALAGINMMDGVLHQELIVALVAQYIQGGLRDHKEPNALHSACVLLDR